MPKRRLAAVGILSFVLGILSPLATRVPMANAIVLCDDYAECGGNAGCMAGEMHLVFCTIECDGGGWAFCEFTP